MVTNSINVSRCWVPVGWIDSVWDIQHGHVSNSYILKLVTSLRSVQLNTGWKVGWRTLLVEKSVRTPWVSYISADAKNGNRLKEKSKVMRRRSRSSLKTSIRDHVSHTWSSSRKGISALKKGRITSLSDELPIRSSKLPNDWAQCLVVQTFQSSSLIKWNPLQWAAESVRAYVNSTD